MRVLEYPLIGAVLAGLQFPCGCQLPCPASGLAPVTILAAREVLGRFTLNSSASHTRSIPNRGLCLLVPRGDIEARRPGARLTLLWLQDWWEDLWRSLTQLVTGYLHGLGCTPAATLRKIFRSKRATGAGGTEQAPAPPHWGARSEWPACASYEIKMGAGPVRVRKTSPEAPMSFCGGDSG